MKKKGGEMAPRRPAVTLKASIVAVEGTDVVLCESDTEPVAELLSDQEQETILATLRFLCQGYGLLLGHIGRRFLEGNPDIVKCLKGRRLTRDAFNGLVKLCGLSSRAEFLSLQTASPNIVGAVVETLKKRGLIGPVRYRKRNV